MNPTNRTSVPCRADGCSRESKYRVKALCSVHYARLRDHGQLELPGKPSVKDQIAGSICIDTAGCWIWQGAIATTGYGRIASSYAHRASYEEFVGPIPDGLTIDHLCRVRACCNPEHLEAVSLRDNILRSEGPSAKQARQTHCIRGHEFSEANTYVYPNSTKRRCRTCMSQRLYGQSI